MLSPTLGFITAAEREASELYYPGVQTKINYGGPKSVFSPTLGFIIAEVYYRCMDFLCIPTYGSCNLDGIC